MDIDARIERRRRRNASPGPVRDYRALSPAAHVEEPVGRGPLLERLLDHLDPVFDGRLPPDAYLHGEFGAGKSAVVTALFSHLDRLSTGSGAVVPTSTRTASPTVPGFVYLDARGTTSEFALYRGLLDALVDEAVPDHGIGTAELRTRLRNVLDRSRTGVVVAVDHVGEPGGPDDDEVLDLFAGLPDDASWLAVGRTDPGETALAEHASTSVRVEPYRRRTLVDLLTARGADGLADRAFDHDLTRRIAGWADGNAHHALQSLLVAASRADEAGRNRIAASDVEAAIGETPRRPVSLGRVLALPANKQLVLRELVDLDADDRASVGAATEAIRAGPAVDLSAGTVERFLYELAEAGVVERVRSEDWDGRGRPPSRVELRFPPTAFRRLYDLRQ